MKNIVILPSILISLIFLITMPAASAVTTHDKLTTAIQTKRSLAVPKLRLFDLGAADYNQDGLIDIHSTAHSYQHSLLQNIGQGNFVNADESAGFNQWQGFPGLENVDKAPSMAYSGLYIYELRPTMKSNDFYTTFVAKNQPIKVTIYMSPQRTIQYQKVTGGEIKVSDNNDTDIIQLTLKPGGKAEIRVSLDAQIIINSPQATYVGSRAIKAPNSTFALRLPDTHANVFSDLNGDGSDDLFRVVGGWGGGIINPQIRGKLQDLTRIYHDGRYTDAALGLQKDDCRGRQGATVDANADGRPDLFETCENQIDGSQGHPVIFYNTSGGWVREELPATGDTGRWLQSGTSTIPKLVMFSGSNADVWQRSSAGWQKLSSATLYGKVSQTTLGDYDNDGNPDIYVSSRQGSTLLKINGQNISGIRPSKFGLPDASSASSWVDANNDGLLDFHSATKGLYKQTTDGSFRRTGELTSPDSYAHIAWIDADNDGRREPIIGKSNGEFAESGIAYWYGTKVLKNNPKARWVELNLPGGWNTARLNVKADTTSKDTVHWAGESETARFSQGHNRVYIVLPEHSKSAIIRVTTANNKTYVISTPANRVVQLK